MFKKIILSLALVAGFAYGAGDSNRGRIQIQGPDVEKRLGKNALSFAWSSNTVVTKKIAISELNKMVAKLTKTEASDRADAITKQKQFINNCPINGCDAPISKSVGNKDISAKRVDIEVITGKAFKN